MSLSTSLKLCTSLPHSQAWQPADRAPVMSFLHAQASPRFDLPSNVWEPRRSAVCLAGTLLPVWCQIDGNVERAAQTVRNPHLRSSPTCTASLGSTPSSWQARSKIRGFGFSMPTCSKCIFLGMRTATVGSVVAHEGFTSSHGMHSRHAVLGWQETGQNRVDQPRR